MARILVADDEPGLREFLADTLALDDHVVVTAPDGKAAAKLLDERGFDLVITDLKMPGGSGLDLLDGVKAARPDTQVVVMTAFATAETAIAAMKRGAYDYLTKPFKVDEIQLVVAKALEHRALVAENRVLRHRVGERRGPQEILGSSPAIEEVRRLVQKVAPTRTTVLVTGESGTGKEVVARAIHVRGGRQAQPFVAINCGAIPEGLIESELFGHERGSFTGAAAANSTFSLQTAWMIFSDTGLRNGRNWRLSGRPNSLPACRSTTTMTNNWPPLDSDSSKNSTALTR